MLLCLLASLVKDLQLAKQGMILLHRCCAFLQLLIQPAKHQVNSGCLRLSQSGVMSLADAPMLSHGRQRYVRLTGLHGMHKTAAACRVWQWIMTLSLTMSII